MKFLGEIVDNKDLVTKEYVDGKINTKVGELKIGDTAYDTVKAYVDQKTSGIATDASLSALTSRVTAAEADIDALQAATAEGGAVTLAIADAKKAGTDAAAAAATAQGAANAAQADIDALKGKVGTVADGKTVVGMIDDVKTACQAKDAELAASIKTISDDYLKAADKTALQGNIDGVSNRVTAIENKNISNGANKVEDSTTNGNIKIDGVETVVYTHPAEHAISEVTGLQSALNAKAAQTSLDTTNTNVTANANAITALQNGKADKATTLAGYGITNAYTKTETYTQAEVDALLTWGSF